MASGGSKQRKTRWDDSRARERDETPSLPPQPPEPGGGSERFGDSGRGLGEGAEEPRVQPGRAAEPWPPQGESRGSQEQLVPGTASHEPWGHQGDGGRSAEPWVQQGAGRGAAEPWHQPGDGNGTAEPWAQQGDNREATAPSVQPGDRRGPEPHILGRAAQEPAGPQAMNMAPQEPWGQQIVNTAPQEQVMPQPVVNLPPQDPWGPHGVQVAGQEPWGQQPVPMTPQEPWGQPGMNIVPQEPWQQQGPNVIPQQPWIQHGPNIAPQQPWIQHGPNAATQQPWVQQGPNAAPQQPWVQQGPNASPQQPWVQQGPNAAPQQPWVQQGPNAAPQQPWGQHAPNVAPQQPWGQHGPNAAPHQQWGQQGPNMPPQQPWGQHGPNAAPQQPWAQHGPNAAPQQPWGQHGPNVVFQEQQGRIPQEPWGQQEEGRWRASQENWVPQGEDRGSKKPWSQQGQGRGRGSREPWGQQWESREQGSQKQWKPQGEGRERGSHGPWGHQGEGRDRRSRGPWGHRGDGRGRGSRGPWGHHGEGRDRGSHMSWGQPGQNRAAQEPWRQQEDGRVRESQKPWGHRREDRRSHEPWSQGGDGREKGSLESRGQQELGREKGSLESRGQQELGKDSGSHEQWSQQREGMGGLSSVPWVQRGGGEGRMPPGQHDESRDSALKEPWGHYDKQREPGHHDSFKGGDGGLPMPSDRQVEVSKIVLQEPVGQPGDAAAVILGQPMWHEAEDSVRSEQPVLKQNESIESRLEDSVGQHVEVKEGTSEEQVGQQKHGMELFPQVPQRQHDELKGMELVEAFSPFVKAEPMVLIEPVEQHNTVMDGLSNDTLEEGREKVCEEPVEQQIEGKQKELDQPLGSMMVAEISSDLSIQQHENGSEEAVGQHKEEKERSDEHVRHPDESREKGSNELVGHKDVLEEVVLPHEDCRVWQSEEPVVQQKGWISGESIAQHEDCKVWQSEESLGRYGDDSKEIPGECAGQLEELRETGSGEPTNQLQECKEGVSDVSILHPDWVRQGLSIEQHVETEGYHDIIEKVLEKHLQQECRDLGSEEPSLASVKNGERASEETVQQHEVGLVELFQETVGQQHEQGAEGFPLEYMELKAGSVERSHQMAAEQQQENLLMGSREPVRQQDLAPQESGVHPGASFKSDISDLPAQLEDMKHTEKEAGENATQVAFAKEDLGNSKMEDRGDGVEEESPQQLRPWEPRETGDKSLLHTIEGSKQYKNVEIKEWQVEEDAAEKANEMQREQGCRGRKESSQSSREKPKSFEDEGDIEIKSKLPVEEEASTRAETKHRRHRVPEEEWNAYREKKHSSKADETKPEQLEDADILVEDEERGTSTKMKHRRHRAHDGDRVTHRERKRMSGEIDRTDEVTKDIKAINANDNIEYGARDEMKLRRHRGYRDDTGDRKPRSREEERSFEEEDRYEQSMKHWDWEKDDGAVVEEQMEPWSGRLHGENEEEVEKVSEIPPWSSKKERKREEKEEGGRERKHKGRERREKQEDDTGGERRHGGSRKKKKRDKSWDDEEGADGEKKHRSREHRREKQQVGEEDGKDVHMKHWVDVKGGQMREEDEGEQWVGSRETDAEDYGVAMSEDMLYWRSQDQDQQDQVVGERKRESSRKERKREHEVEEAESERRHWGGTERQSKQDEDGGGQEIKSSRKKERKREHEDAGGGERKHRSSRKKQRRREEDESKQWSDNESERKKGRLGEWEGEDEGEGKHMGERRERNIVEDEDGVEMEMFDNSNRLDGSREEEFEYYLSARENEQHRVKLDVQHPGTEMIQANVYEKERKRGKVQGELGEVGQVKDGADEKKEENVEDATYMDVVRYKVLEHDGSERQRCSDGEKGKNLDKTADVSGVERHDMGLDWEKREELGEDMLDVGYGGISEEKNKEAERDVRREVMHAPGIEAKRIQFKEGDMAEQNDEPEIERISEQERGGDWNVHHVPETEERKLVIIEDGRGKYATGIDEWIDGEKVMKQKPVSVEGKEESEGSVGGDIKHIIGLERRLDWSGREVRPESGRKPRRMFLDDPGEEVKHVHVKEERKKAPLEGGEVDFLPGRVEGTKVEHAFGIYSKLVTGAVDGAGEQSHVGLQQEKNSGQHPQQEFCKNRHIDGIPLVQDLFKEGDCVSTFDKDSEKLPTPTAFPEEGVGGGGKGANAEKPIPPAPSTQDGSIRERERRREMLLRSLASFKESGGADRKKDQPPTKEDVGRFGGKESMKIELLSPALSRQLAAAGAKERKKDHPLPPPAKEEKSSSKETKAELQTTPAAKDLDGEERCVGPLPAEASQTRRRKVLEFERVYLDNLPSATMYERSYMHRDVITHVACTKTDFIITASHDGHVKFWKKIAEGIEFVKHFRSHLGVIESIAVSSEGALFCSVGEDQAMKVFDVVNFDMINMLKLGYHPGQCEWIFCPGDAISAVASSEKSTGKIYVYDGRGSNKPMHVFERLHSSPLTQIRLNAIYKVVVSADKTGMMEYWTGPPQEYKFPKNVHWEYKTDTDLYEFAKCKAHLTSMCFAPDGKKIATIGSDRKVRIFRFLTGKLMRVFDESLSMFTELQQMRQQLPDMEFGRRMAVERELEKVDAIRLINIIFDETGHFVLYGTMLGIKVINVETNRCVRILGKQENVRILQISMFQGVARKHRAAATVEMKASDNPVLMSIQADPTIVCTAFKKNRFYLFSKREPEDTKSADSDRDVFNEKPSKEEVMAATQAEGPKRVSDSAIVHTSMGDVHVKLFPVECPKTVENFCVHSRNGYYNGHTFHRIIKGFMVQTGDPSGTGMGGESIWGGEFEDEFHSTLRHDRPYTLSMANAGSNSNGSQFFLTVVPTPWLDNKHTVFGRVTKGMEVVQRISNVKVNPKTDKPYEDISIISITVK